MAEFTHRADAVDVEQIMQQIRARIREKRGVDYTEDQIQELAKIRLEKFLDPKGVRSDLLDQFRRTAQQNVPPTYEFDDTTLIRSGNPLVGFVRRLLQPILKLFFSPNPLVHALHVQTQINSYLLERAQGRPVGCTRAWPVATGVEGDLRMRVGSSSGVYAYRLDHAPSAKKLMRIAAAISTVRLVAVPYTNVHRAAIDK